MTKLQKVLRALQQRLDRYISKSVKASKTMILDLIFKIAKLEARLENKKEVTMSDKKVKNQAPTDTIKKLRKCFKAYNYPEIVYDVFCDRVNFYFAEYQYLYFNFFTECRGIIIDRDRAGYSISIDDAKKLDIPMDKASYIIQCKDIRKKGY